MAKLNNKNVGIDINVANELLKPRTDLYKAINPETTVVCGDITKEEIYNKIIKAINLQ